MATLTVQDLKRTGLALATVAAAGGGDKFLPSKDTFLYVNNGGAGAITVTVATPNEVPGLPDVGQTDVSVSVPAGAARYIGPFPYEFFSNSADGLADITYSGVATVTVAAVKLNKP